MKALVQILFAFFLIISNLWATEDKIVVDTESLFVVHTSRLYIQDIYIKAGLDQVIEQSARGANKIIYVMKGIDDEGWFTALKHPDHIVLSDNGFFDNIVYVPDAVSFSGGYLSLCLDRAIGSVISSYFEGHRSGQLVITLHSRAIYEDLAFFLQAISGSSLVRAFAWSRSLLTTPTLADIIRILGPEMVIKTLQRYYLEMYESYTIEIKYNSKTYFKKNVGDKKIIFHLL